MYQIHFYCFKYYLPVPPQKHDLTFASNIFGLFQNSGQCNPAYPRIEISYLHILWCPLWDTKISEKLYIVLFCQHEQPSRKKIYYNCCCLKLHNFTKVIIVIFMYLVPRTWKSIMYSSIPCVYYIFIFWKLTMKIHFKQHSELV